MSVNILFLRQLEIGVDFIRLSPRSWVTAVKGIRVDAIPFAHLNREKIESNLSVPGIQGCHENAIYKSFETSPLLICL